jgi:hypothetical protein
MKQTRWILMVVALLGGLSASADDSLRRLKGQFLQLTTDLESQVEAQRLVDSFDAAVPQWIGFWNLAEADLTGFRVDAFVMRDKSRFEREGLIPANVPDFPFGYAMGQQLWVHAQPSEYYTRHLTLHEGVHCFAFAAFNGAGPTWFQEGTAELLSTHQGVGPELKVNRIPARREDVPYWGRFTLMNSLREQGKMPSLSAVMGYQPDLRGDVQTYGWSWAANMLLDAYPEYHDALLTAARQGEVTGPGFNRQLQQSLLDHWPILLSRWRVMCHELDYGFDWSRERVALSTKDPVWSGKPITVEVAADRGWQSIGVRVPRGSRLQFGASGEVILATTTKPWNSQPAGITYEFHRGRPLGQLLACLLPNAVDPEDLATEPLPIHNVSEGQVLQVPEFSWLLLRVNDAVSQLGDNEGSYRVVISHSASASPAEQ